MLSTARLNHFLCSQKVGMALASYIIELAHLYTGGMLQGCTTHIRTLCSVSFPANMDMKYIL